MEHYYPIVKDNPLFANIDIADFSSILMCLGAFTKNYDKKEVIFLAGEEINYIGLVISGSVNIIQEDIHANVSILAEASVGETFAEVFSCVDIMHFPVTVITREKSKILFLDCKKLMKTCNNGCVFHSNIIENLLKIIAQKCLFFNNKVQILSKRTTREKVLAFLLYMGNGSKKVKIDLNREEMANFICVDRSSLSAELSKMQKEKIIVYNKNQFEILDFIGN